MDYELPLDKTNRILLARAFSANKRVDYSLDCVLEDQMGKAYTDSLENPTAFRITIGPFWYYAGDASSSGGCELMKDFPAYSLLMPSPPAWIELGHRLHPLKPFERYSFCASSLTEEHMASLVDSSPYRDRIAPLDASLINCLAQRPEGYFDLSDFDGVDDFLARGYGFTIPDGDDLMGVAYSSLVCSRGIEVSVYIEEKYRMKGAATALAARLVLECLRHGLRPNWDAANPESCRLAERLGYHLRESYKAYYYT